MPRIVRFTERTPLVLPPSAQETKVCRCGISKTFPLCDNACTLTEGEDASLTYTYDAKGKRKVLEEAKDDRKSLSSAWKWVLPVAYILIPANMIATLTGYLKLPAQYAKKGTVPGVPGSLVDKVPYGFLFPILLQVLLVVALTWLSFHPQYTNPQKFLEMLDTKVDHSMKDRFHLWTRRLIAIVALLVSAFFTYVSAAIVIGALVQDQDVSPLVVGVFLLVLVGIIATWVILVRRNLRENAATAAAALAADSAPEHIVPPPSDADRPTS